MAKIIELLGPSGVGKSALYFSLQKQWKEDDTWALYHDFRYKRKKNSIASYLMSIKSAYYKMSNTDYIWSDGKITDNKKEFVEKYPEFIGTFLDIIHEKANYSVNGKDNRFYLIHYMMRTIEQLNNILSNPHDQRICLMYESLLCRIMHLSSPNFREEDLLMYLKHMPLPFAVIYLKASPNTILERIKKRTRTATIHDGLAENEILALTIHTQKLMEYANDYLVEKNVQIISIDAETPIPALTNKVIQYLSN